MLVVLPLLVAIIILVVIGVLAFALVAGGEEATLQDGLHIFYGSLVERHRLIILLSNKSREGISV